MNDLHQTEHLLVGFIVIALMVVLGGMYLIHHSTDEVQASLNQSAATAQMKERSSDQILEGRLLNTAVPSASAETSMEAPAEPVLPWWQDDYQRVKNFFMPSSNEPAPPAQPPLPQRVRVFDQAPAATVRDGSDEDEPQEAMAWKDPPSGIHPVSGDALDIEAPGVHLEGVQVSGVISAGKNSIWLLNPTGSDSEALEAVIHHPPKHLKITLQR